jgi:branched-chain amino acid transport system permease protein
MQKITHSFRDKYDTDPQFRKIIKIASILSIIAIGIILSIAAIIRYGPNESFVRASKSVVDGLALSMLLFLMVSGFYLIFGLCDVINFAHGSFFMLGGFMGFFIYMGTESALIEIIGASSPFVISVLSFIVSAIGATAVLAIIGGGIEISTIRRLYGNAIAQILLTVGFMFVIDQLSQILWGSSAITRFLGPSSQLNYFFISGILDFGGALKFELYRIFLIFLGLGVALVMYVAFRKTRIGLQIQAGIEDSEMVEALGTDIKKLFTLVFMIGAGLAGFSGAVLVPWIGANTGHGLTYLIFAFVIVVVGGAHYGRFEGTFFGALIIGLSMQFTAYFLQGLENIIVFIIMALILILKPGGLTGHA